MRIKGQIQRTLERQTQKQINSGTHANAQTCPQTNTCRHTDRQTDTVDMYEYIHVNRGLQTKRTTKAQAQTKKGQNRQTQSKRRTHSETTRRTDIIGCCKRIAEARQCPPLESDEMSPGVGRTPPEPDWNMKPNQV